MKHYKTNSRAVRIGMVAMSMLLALGIMFSCTSVPDDASVDRRIDEVMDRWHGGLTGADLDLMMSAYHPDATLHGLGPEGPMEVVGRDAIREAQEPGMEIDWEIFDFSREDDRSIDGAHRAYVLSIPGEVSFVNSFVYDAGDGLIVEQWISVVEGE